MWGSLLIALGLGALGYGVLQASKALGENTQAATKNITESGVSKLADRISTDGILSALLPAGLGKVNSEDAQNSGSAAGDRLKDPSAWGSLIGSVGKVGIDIYNTASAGGSVKTTGAVLSEREPD